MCIRDSIWYVRLDVQNAKRNIAFTASYNQAFLRICEGMRCSDELAFSGTMTTDVSLNASNTVLKDIQYAYAGSRMAQTAPLAKPALARHIIRRAIMIFCSNAVF